MVACAAKKKVYAVFGVTLSVFRNSLIDSGPSYDGDGRMESQDRNQEAPPYGNNGDHGPSVVRGNLHGPCF